MELKDYLALFISIISLSISGLALYFNYWKKAKLLLSIGNKAHLYHPRDGGTGIYLELNILNEFSVEGKIRKAWVEIVDDSGNSYKLAWRRRCKVDDKREYFDISGSRPFFIDKKSFMDVLFWFWWPQNEKNKLEFKPGKYSFRVYYWQNNDKGPSMTESRDLDITEEGANYLSNNREKNDPRTWIKPFSNEQTIGIHSTGSDPNWWKNI